MFLFFSYVDIEDFLFGIFLAIENSIHSIVYQKRPKQKQGFLILNRRTTEEIYFKVEETIL